MSSDNIFVTESSCGKVFRLEKKFLSKRKTLQTSYIYIYIYIYFVNFKNLTVEFHVPYVLNIHIKFHSNRILFTFRLINLFFIHNFRSQKLEILRFLWWHSNDFWSFWNFANIKDMIRIYNITVRFLKFTLNIKIYKEFEKFLSKLV